MNKIFSVPVLITFSLLLFSTALIIHIPAQAKINDTNGGIFKPYMNPTFGIQMQRPPDWTVAENKNHSVDNIEVVNFSSPVSEDVTVSVDTVNSTTPTTMATALKQYVNDSILSDLKTSPNFKLLEPNTNTTLGGNPAYSITYTDKDQGGPYKGMDIVTMKNDKAYDISYTADPDRYDSVFPTVQTMINSFKITSK
jgi:eukaryotic-like serine/threonine-protein kinase